MTQLGVVQDQKKKMEMDQVQEKMEMDQDVSGIGQDKEGKTPVSCQLCDEIDKIKWKCITCDYLMCERCCKGHKKIKSCNEHTIIDFKDIGLYQGTRCGIHSIKCLKI
jgi:antirestriction protein